MMKKILASLCCFFLLLGTALTVNATSLQTLFDGDDITVGDKLFFNWTLINLVSTDPSLDPDFDLIEVTGLNDQPLNPGLHFDVNGQLVATDLNFVDLTFGFSVATLSGKPLIKDNSLEITEHLFDPFNFGGLITIVENIFDPAGATLGEKWVYADYLFGEFQLFDSADFNTQSLIHVEKNIFVGGDFDFDYVSLDSFEQRFSQVPEPTTMLLFGTGIVGVVGAARRKKKYQA